MNTYNHETAMNLLRHSLAGIAEGRIPLRDLSRPIRERNNGVPGPYYMTASALIFDARQVPEGFGGYLNSHEDAIDSGSFARLRVVRADSIIRLKHTGWFTDDDGMGDTCFGVVARLPRSRGFLAGWSLGANMATSFSRTIHDTEEEAARAADREAELSAEREREYQREHAESEQ